MNRIPIGVQLWILLLATLVTLAGVTCDSSGPQAREFSLEISERQASTGKLEVKRGDTVTLRISADERAVFHLHGYDHEFGLNPNEVTTFEFVANAEGSYPFSLHGFGAGSGAGSNEAGHDATEEKSHDAGGVREKIEQEGDLHDGHGGEPAGDDEIIIGSLTVLP